ncbi:hypothetical protein VTO42DRAFT_25 [Malbranchea cinnamomea]
MSSTLALSEFLCKDVRKWAVAKSGLIAPWRHMAARQAQQLWLACDATEAKWRGHGCWPLGGKKADATGVVCCEGHY